MTDDSSEMQQIRTRSPFPWTQQVNFNGLGSVRLVDAAGMEVPLLSITTMAVIVSRRMAAQSQGAPA